jgi:selenocysteine-specific elongation factor
LSENPSLPQINTLRTQVADALAHYHATYPLRHGMPREELRTLLHLAPFEFNLLLKELKAEHLLITKGKWIAQPTHKVVFSPFELVKVNALMGKFAAAPFAPPSVKDARNEVGRDLFYRMIENGDLVQVSDEVIFRAEDYDAMQAKVRELIEQNGKVAASEVRDMFGTSRKYALALLEHFDKIGLTLRDGDYHRLLA